MNVLPSVRSVTPTIDTYIKLAQYPILSDRIRVRMREELFRRGIVSQQVFEQEVQELAVESQKQEGLSDPYSQEEEGVWQKRKERIRDFHTDAYFANNLGSTLLDQIIYEVLRAQPLPSRTDELTFNPEIAPWELLFRQGEIYEALPLPEQEKVQHHLQELKAVLIKRMLSDQLPFIGVARKIFTIADLNWVYRRLIGDGRIGGKAATMLLAWKILHKSDFAYGPDISQSVGIPETFFIGSELIYEYILLNHLDRFINQKYLPVERIRQDYGNVLRGFLQGRFPDYIQEQLREVLFQMGKRPFIVRSSSLLEDNLSHAFAGKYDSYFCPNQGNDDENLRDLLQAVQKVFASTFNPDAMSARQQAGLIDYDERMAVMIQEVCGVEHGRYFFPTVAGMGLSRNPLCWNEQIRTEEGLLRLVWGFSERVMNSLESQGACMVSLSHPQLRQIEDLELIRLMSQRFIKVVDLTKNEFDVLPIQDVLYTQYPYLRYIASIDANDQLQDIQRDTHFSPSDEFLLTFSNLTRDARFVKLMRTALRRLEEGYDRPVEVEFAIEFVPHNHDMDYKLYILECRPQTMNQA